MNKVSSTKRLWLSLSLLMILAMILSACGSAPAQPAATNAPATNPPGGVAATEAGATAAATEVPTVDPNAVPTPVVNAFGNCANPLVLWHGLTGSDGAVFATLLEQFAKENPDTCINSEGYPWDIFFQKYPTATAAGQPPDMV